MRMSAESLLNGEHLPHTLTNTKVLLEGKEVTKVFEADAVEGWLRRHTGKISTENPDELEEEILWGKVEFVLSVSEGQ